MALNDFEKLVSCLGLHVWQNCKRPRSRILQQAVQLQFDSRQSNHMMDGVDKFTYCGSMQSSTGRCYSDISRKMGIAVSTMHSFQRVRWQDQLLRNTKLCLYHSCVRSVTLWTLLLEYKWKLEFLYLGCQRQIFNIY